MTPPTNSAQNSVGVNVAPSSVAAVFPEFVRKAKSPKEQLLIGITTAAVFLGTWFVPFNGDRTARHALAVGLFMIISWMTELMPHAVTGLIGCYLFWALKVVRFDVAFSGFVQETTWFYMGVLLFGMMASETGLARRLAVYLLMRVGSSYSKILLGLIVLSFLLTFIVPSGVACVVIQASVVIGLLRAFGYGPGTNVARGMFITLTYTAGLFDKMLIAGAASILGRGLIVKFTGKPIYWSQWFLAYLPLSIATILILWRFVLWLYPPEERVMKGGAEYFAQERREIGPWTSLEKRAVVLMGCGLALWMTDFVHHVSPAIIGIGVGLLGLVPGIGVLQFDVAKAKLNYMSIFFVGSALSLGAVLSESKALGVLTGVLFSWMAPLMTNKFMVVMVPYWAALGYHLFLGNELSMLSTSMPALIHFAQVNNFDPVALGMVWTFASGGKIFVYQSAVMIVGYSYGYFDARDMLRVGSFLCIVESLLLLIVFNLWWPRLGI
jgi:anion transporter